MATKVGDFRELSLHLTSFRELRYQQTHLRQTGTYNEKYLFQRAADLRREKVAKKHETTHCGINGTWTERRQNLQGSPGKGLEPSQIVGTPNSRGKDPTDSRISRRKQFSSFPNTLYSSGDYAIFKSKFLLQYKLKHKCL